MSIKTQMNKKIPIFSLQKIVKFKIFHFVLLLYDFLALSSLFIGTDSISTPPIT